MNELAIIGLGTWGRKLLSEFAKYNRIKICCTNGDKKNVEWLQRKFPEIKHTTNYQTILDDPKIIGIVIVTPIKTHYKLVKKALNAKKHVFVEKPFAENDYQV